MNLLRDPNVLGNLESAAKILALVIGGWWTYSRFIRVRERFPKAQLKHQVIDRPLSNQARLINVRVDIDNIGLTAMRILYIDTRVQQLEPLVPGELEARIREAEPHTPTAKTQIPWYSIAHRVSSYEPGYFVIEPGESDWIEYDFIVGEPVRRIRVYTFVKNEAQRRGHLPWSRKATPLGWREAYYHLISGSVPSQSTKEATVESKAPSTTGEEQAAPERTPERRPPSPPERQGAPENVPPRRPNQPETAPLQGVPEPEPEPRPQVPSE